MGSGLRALSRLRCCAARITRVAIAPAWDLASAETFACQAPRCRRHPARRQYFKFSTDEAPSKPIRWIFPYRSLQFRNTENLARAYDEAAYLATVIFPFSCEPSH